MFVLFQLSHFHFTSVAQLFYILNYLFQAGIQNVPVVLDGVVPVLVKGPQQLLQALLHPPRRRPVQLLVSITAEGVEGVRVARHGELLLLVDLQVIIQFQFHVG